MSDPFYNRSNSRSIATGIMAMATVVLAAHPALGMFSGEIAPEESILPPDLPIFGALAVSLVVAVFFFIVSHVLSRR